MGAALGGRLKAIQQQRRSRRGSLRDAGDVGGPPVFGQGVKAAEVQQQGVAVTDSEILQAGHVALDQARGDPRSGGVAARGGQRFGHRIDAGDFPAVGGQVDGVGAGAAAQIQGTSGR